MEPPKKPEKHGATARNGHEVSTTYRTGRRRSSRNRVPELESTYRNQPVNHEPETHKPFGSASWIRVLPENDQGLTPETAEPGL